MDEQKRTTWTVEYGVHRGTINSRGTYSDDGYPDLEACQKYITEQEQFYRSIGYVIWYAHAIDPDGKQHILRGGNTNYR